LLASSPAAVATITSALQKEAAILNIKNVGIHNEGHHNHKKTPTSKPKNLSQLSNK
jgi:hypothetical protein